MKTQFAKAGSIAQAKSKKASISAKTTKKTTKAMTLANLATLIFAGVTLTLSLCWAQPATQESTSSAPVSQTVAAGVNSSVLKTHAVEVSGQTEWTDTNIDLRSGEKLQITAEGTITYPARGNHPAKSFGPQGITRSIADVIHEYSVPNGAHGELIGRLGSGDAAEPFELGATGSYTAPVAGRLFLGINQSMKDAADATGSFKVNVEVLNSGLSTAAGALVGGPAESPMPAITGKLLDSIPRRIGDKQHNPGDMVNILIVGTEADLVKAFTTADWVKVDRSVESTVMSGLMDTFEKKDYLTMPMSTLYLFDRPQDYGFAHAEPVRVVMSRNHLRVWKSPYQVGGRPLWCIAATHDIGFERDQRNNGLTHKIDPAIDGEREFVNQTLSGTGLVASRAHLTPPSPLTTAKTATGGEFHSDGRILVLVLTNAAAEN
jgi:hypothetical protein